MQLTIGNSNIRFDSKGSGSLGRFDVHCLVGQSDCGKVGVGIKSAPPPAAAQQVHSPGENRSLLLRGLVETLTEWGEPLKHSNMV